MINEPQQTNKAPLKLMGLTCQLNIQWFAKMFTPLNLFPFPQEKRGKVCNLVVLLILDKIFKNPLFTDVVCPPPQFVLLRWSCFEKKWYEYL